MANKFNRGSKSFFFFLNTAMPLILYAICDVFIKTLIIIVFLYINSYLFLLEILTNLPGNFISGHKNISLINCFSVENLSMVCNFEAQIQNQSLRLSNKTCCFREFIVQPILFHFSNKQKYNLS